MRVVTPRWASSFRVWRVSSQATRSASASALASRGEASSRFPMGVAQTVSLPSFIRGRLLDDLVVGGLPLLELLAGGEMAGSLVCSGGSRGLASDTGVP